MSTIFSRQCEYAIQAVLYLALKPHEGKTSIKELTQQLEIPYHFVAKILQDLGRKGLLISLKGPSGGFALARRPEEITLLEIVDAIDGTGFLHDCVLGFPECSSKTPCPAHDRWAKVRESIGEMLIGQTVAQMAKNTHKPQYRQKKR